MLELARRRIRRMHFERHVSAHELTQRGGNGAVGGRRDESQGITRRTRIGGVIIETAWSFRVQFLGEQMRFAVGGARKDVHELNGPGTKVRVGETVPPLEQ